MNAWMTAAQLRDAYAKKTLSPVEVVRAQLDRIEKIDSRYNAFLHVDADNALKAARQAEQALLSGKSLGPLHGVPVGIKDIIDIAGQTTTCHSKVMQGTVATQDADCITALRQGGAILMGKLALHEFAIGGPSFDLPYPPARNPWNTNHHPGGSSSGSGAALAAGLVPLALGTDTGGSVRHPAAACGVVGLKPTYDLVSRRGVYPLSFSLDHVGPMARTVLDTSLLLEALTATSTSPRAFKAGPLDRGIAGLRIGVIRHFHLEDEVAEPEMAAAFEEACRVFEGLGAQLVDIRLPSLQEFSAPQKIILMAEGWAVHAKSLRARPGDFAEMSRRKLLCGAFLSAGDYVQAMQCREALMDSVDQVLQQVDVLVVANSMDPACVINDLPEVVRTYTRQARVPFNLTGHPALAVPNGFSKAGLPLSMQIVGRYYDEASIFRVGAAYEQATAWHGMHPAACSA
jgi:aspartyl-tRNA(Asn)/glutamyl-tRNA(Gln) amidotransferase subunit A